MPVNSLKSVHLIVNFHQLSYALILTPYATCILGQTNFPCYRRIYCLYTCVSVHTCNPLLIFRHFMSHLSHNILLCLWNDMNYLKHDQWARESLDIQLPLFLGYNSPSSFFYDFGPMHL